MRTDVFGLALRQSDLFGAPQESFDAPMTAEEIRAELEEAITLMRCSDVCPWPTAQMLRIDTMFPDMAARLPAADERRLLDAFLAESARFRSRGAA